MFFGRTTQLIGQTLASPAMENPALETPIIDIDKFSDAEIEEPKWSHHNLPNINDLTPALRHYVELKKEEVQFLFEEVEANEGYKLTVNLAEQSVNTDDCKKFFFEIDSFAKNCLLQGLDDVGWTLQFEENILDFEKKTMNQKPWFFPDL